MKTYSRLPRDKPGFPNPQGVSFGTFVQQMHQHQLYPGGHLQTLEENFRSWFNANLSLTALQRICSHFATPSTGDTMVMPLDRWCSELSLRAGEFAYFGTTLGRINPDLASDFLVFDDLGWQVLYQYPSIFSRKMAAARKRIQSTFRRYLEVPQSERIAGSAVCLITAYEDEAKAIGISDDDLAILLFNIHWVIRTNTRKIAFWLLSNALHTPPLLDRNREETAPARATCGSATRSSTASGTRRCGCARARTRRRCGASTTTPRWAASSCAKATAPHHDPLPPSCTSTRPSTAATAANSGQIGGSLPVAHQHQHQDKHDSSSSNSRSKTLALKCGPSWRPFGGGKTLCTGRHAAKRATLMLVAVLLWRFDV
ncbi:hypothetical protein F4777DRAFT_583174 [Nemania sp. FL0916]|nr:hypothetical protein F4777DRAFT_583174 [Nemania sp. FL0916]